MAHRRREQSTRSVAGRLLASSVPAVAAWRGFARAFLNLALFGLTAVTAVWLVHQTEYRIEYGSRFGAVMQSTPHHLYMVQLGLLLALFAASAVFIAGRMLRRSHAGHRSLMRLLPRRLSRHAHVELALPPLRAVLTTAGLLALFQITLYLLQENVESLTFVGNWPGMDVLIAPRHLTVIPLHLLAATIGSTLLWLAAAFFRRDRRVTQLVRVLADIVARRWSCVVRCPGAAISVLRALLLTGSCSPRAPPFCALTP